MTATDWINIVFIIVLLVTGALAIFFKNKIVSVQKEVILKLTGENAALSGKFELLETHHKNMMEMSEKQSKVIGKKIEDAEKEQKELEEKIKKFQEINELNDNLLELVDEQSKAIQLLTDGGMPEVNLKEISDMVKNAEKKNIIDKTDARTKKGKKAPESIEDALKSSVLSDALKNELSDHPGNPFRKWKETKENPWPPIENSTQMKIAITVLATTVSKRDSFVMAYGEKATEACINLLRDMIKAYQNS
jgi:hypothetical protein